MSRLPDFSKVAFRGGKDGASVNATAWEKEFSDVTGDSPDNFQWLTNEQISIKPLYTAEDTSQLEHTKFVAGLPPFLRGPYATMYVTLPWTVRQYAGFSTAE